MVKKKEEHTTFAVGPISEPRMRDILADVLGWGDGEPGRVALREELARSGVMWYIGSSASEITRLREKGVSFTRADLPKPNIAWDAWIQQKLPDRNYLVVDHASHQVIVVDFDLNVLWDYGEFLVSGSDLTHLFDPRKAVYNPDLNRVLISSEVNDRVLEIDYATKAVTNVLTSTAKGPVTWRTAATYGIRGMVISCELRHWIAEVTWGGAILWEFGEYGVLGSDLTHLSYPGTAIYDPQSETYRVADGGNNRVLVIGKDGVVKEWYPALQPFDVGMSKSGLLCIACHGDVSYVSETGHIYYWSPNRSDFLVLTDDYTLMWNWEHQSYELDLRSWKPGKKPNSLAFSYNLGIAASSPIVPLHTFASEEPPSIFALSDQAATLDIYIWNPPVKIAIDMTGAGDVVPGTPWVLYDTEAMTANTVAPYVPTCRVPFVGVRVTMGAVAGAAKIWWHEKWVS